MAGPRARGVTVPATVENGPVSEHAAGLSVDEIMDLLASGAARSLSPDAGVSQLDHALQTASLLEHDFPGDHELAAAGLVHDIGHLLPGGTDEAHATDAAREVRRVLGSRVAGMVGLHVAAKRYLVATDGGYGGILTADSVVSLGHQGGAMDQQEAAAFLSQPLAAGAVTLRRADDNAKVEGLVVRDLGHWVALLRGLSGRAVRPG